MARTILSAAVLLASLGASQAQTGCYPRMGAYSGQYEGSCPNAGLKWTAVENTVGAFGRNCSDEPWTYNRKERMFYNPKANEAFAMQDCDAPGAVQSSSAVRISVASDAVRRFHENKIPLQEKSARPLPAPSR
jgi:hypothetical protein